MPSLSSRSEATLVGAALAAILVGLYAAIPGPPKPLKDRLRGPDAALGERDKVMDLDVYGEQGWWWTVSSFPERRKHGIPVVPWRQSCTGWCHQVPH